ncbi:MAG: endonuclease III domain-containing protein [Sedimenticolaceae bacterium]
MHALYVDLVAIYGEQPWWPAETPFEVVVGAVLTQNAAWSNVEKAIDRLRAARLLSLKALLATGHAELAEVIRSSGYFNVKARRLRNLCEFLADQGGLEGFSELSLSDQRAGLLSVNGIGPETADDILLYALEQPVFVIDSYTRRLLHRLGWTHGAETYEDLRSGFERALPGNVYQYQQFHALIVMHAKAACRKVPRCAQCALAPKCPAASR